MASMRIFGGGGAFEPLFHDHRERKLAASCLRATRGLEEKGRLFFLYPCMRYCLSFGLIAACRLEFEGDDRRILQSLRSAGEISHRQWIR